MRKHWFVTGQIVSQMACLLRTMIGEFGIFAASTASRVSRYVNNAQGQLTYYMPATLSTDSPWRIRKSRMKRSFDRRQGDHHVARK